MYTVIVTALVLRIVPMFAQLFFTRKCWTTKQTTDL